MYSIFSKKFCATCQSIYSVCRAIKMSHICKHVFFNKMFDLSRPFLWYLLILQILQIPVQSPLALVVELDHPKIFPGRYLPEKHVDLVNEDYKIPA